MFDLVTGSMNRPLRERSVSSKIIAIVAHGFVIAALLAIPLFQLTELPPVVPTIMAFVAAQPAAPPPPPPPPAPAPVKAQPAAQPARTSGELAAPI